MPRRHRRLIAPSLFAAVALTTWYACAVDELTEPRPPAAPSAPETVNVLSTAHAGILFGSMNLSNAVLSDVHTGAWRRVSPKNIIAELSGARAKGGRVILRLAPGDLQLKNPDGTFSLATWKSMVDRYRTIDFREFVLDGTLVAHYLIDEPHMTARWKGGISQSTVEAMARYSKGIWPEMTTVVRALPSWLAEARITYKYLDAAYAQYAARRGDPASWLAGEVAVAKRLNLGLVLSMNVLDGGDGTSGIPGLKSGKYAMSAAELKRYGTVMLNESYGCAFIMYMYHDPYYNRWDIRRSMAELSRLARNHPSTSCQQ